MTPASLSRDSTGILGLDLLGFDDESVASRNAQDRKHGHGVHAREIQLGTERPQTQGFCLTVSEEDFGCVSTADFGAEITCLSSTENSKYLLKLWRR
jgi:hypothetical protein